LLARSPKLFDGAAIGLASSLARKTQAEPGKKQEAPSEAHSAPSVHPELPSGLEVRVQNGASITPLM